MLRGFRLRTNDAVGHPTPEQLLQDALAPHRSGRSGDAKRLYASVLRVDPTNAAAFGNLGIIAAQEGDLASAERLFRQEIKVRPDDPAGYNNLGSVLQLQARSADAVAAHRPAIKLKPKYSGAYFEVRTRKPTTTSACCFRCRAGSTGPRQPIAKRSRCGRPMRRPGSISVRCCI